MTPTPDIEPIREGLARALHERLASLDPPDERVDWEDCSPAYREVLLSEADACLTYLIKRQAFHSDAYAVIKKEGLGK